ncbi:hypothetical protein [Streptomyces ossamyceticus]|uniref:hypothetical protein n=1 Tax=Streptomyces ossamyceticus TaxID=249581 RepID=UPI000B11A72D|nr:hypothetical protein [Streptomyces ossamyceticus]
MVLSTGCTYHLGSFPANRIGLGGPARTNTGRVSVGIDHDTAAWKLELAQFAAETALMITVRPLPRGSSKWNKGVHARR